ncbi:MAG TPA: HD-GYP domain-containing protein [Dehalococcoidia bacterium]|nr:HD-GYP domain-containing protein [Dehalococcoidia bacterium]
MKVVEASSEVADSAGKSALPVRILRRLKADADLRRAWLFRAMMAAEIAAGVVAFALVVPDFSGDWHLFLLLLSLNLIAERYPTSIYGDSEITIGFVFTTSIICLFGAPGVAISGALEATARRVGRNPLMSSVYVRNVFRAVLTYVCAALVYEWVSVAPPPAVTLDVVFGALAATVVAFAISALLVTLSVSLRSGQPVAQVWENHRWIAPHFLALGVVGIGLTAAYLGLGFWGIAAFLVPALMLQVSTRQYVARTAEHVEQLKRQNKALEAANIQIRSVSDELRVTYDSTLVALVNALEARDQETKGHSVRVARYMVTIAESLGVKPGTQEWTDMHHGALLHDVGKIGVVDSILRKPGKLTPEEWHFMRQHPEIGFKILREVPFLRGAAEIVLAHHERWDGQGYPRGLREEEIPLGARIFAVVDTFDTMTSDRVYRKALSPPESLEEILRCSGTQFDPLVVEAFLEIYTAWVEEWEELHGRRAAVRSAA